MCDPLERYKNLPYYGFMIDPNSPTPKDPNSRPKVILSPVVSPPKPVPDFYARHVTAKRARRAEDGEQDHEEVAKRLDEQAAEKHAAEVRQAEREERRRQRDKKALHLSKAAAVERTPEDEAVLKRALLKQNIPKLVRGPPSTTTVNVFL